MHEQISIEDLKYRINNCFREVGVPEKQAVIIAEHLITTEAGGVTTHGLRMVKPHVNRFKSKKYNLNPQLKIERQTTSLTVLDADNGIGIYTAHEAMKIAMEQSKQTGLHAVFSKNANTFGAAFTLARMATEQGFIGIVFSNSPAAMAPWGGKKPLIGTNPIAIGIPSATQGPIVFDMATSKVAKSKIGLAHQNGEDIPLGWALDKEGQPTTNPAEALKGTVLPLADYKGYGLALCLDILSGLLSGAGFADEVDKFYTSDTSNKSMNVGHTFIVLSPKLILGHAFYERVDQYIQKIHLEKGVRYPGEQTNKKLAEAIKSGIKLDKEAFDFLF